MNELEALGLSIKSRRQELGISQETLAVNTNTARPHLSKIEIGSASIGSKKLVALVKELKLKPFELWKMADDILSKN